MGVSRKQSRSNFLKNEHFLPPDRHMYLYISGVRNVSFLENFTCFVFLKHLFWDLPFCLITDDYGKIAVFCWNIFSENIAKLVTDNVVCEKL